ncbi:NmrA family NAD(P)-binding protein [Pararhizobium sp.]|uniref:NmrA family NAD(P)-binding protein n=1 Tax=Pararhizobium sp. TaxID=1977563 RepID=UPI00271E05B9|nr:NmrA family NAD(P)-binding protein [Pararhizobium sp.]MDO9418768.1 NmrA family NAD(P)-binding protein [Pararhizobium sp.]
MSDKLLITGAAGGLGRLILDSLLAGGKVSPSDLIATSRDPAKLADYAAKGVETRTADFNDTASLDAAFSGADRILIISTDALDDTGTRKRQHLAAIAAAKKASAKHILYTSMPNPENSVIPFAPDHLESENAVKATGIPYTILRNGWYMENLFMTLPSSLAGGQWFTSAGTGNVAHIAKKDIAKAIAAALLDASLESRTYTLTGTTLHTSDQIAELAAKATGKPLEVVHLTDEQLAGGMKAHGVPEFLIPLFVSFDTNTREGLIAMQTDDAGNLSGETLQPLDEFLVENKAALTA